MKVHLLRSKELSPGIFNEVVDFLSSFDGPIQFIGSDTSIEYDNNDIPVEQVDKERFFKQDLPEGICMEAMCDIPDHRLQASWNDLFEWTADYRAENNIPAQDFVILLTEVANEYNWFSALDPANPNNGFVHADEWEHYIKSSPVFPIAYLVASLIFQKNMFSNMKELQDAVHEFPLGCINDFCHEKREIILKLRTADACGDCLDLLEGKLDPPEIQQVLNIFEGVRLRMLFTQNFRKNLKPSRLKVNNRNKIFLPDYGNMEVKLTPLEKTLYLFFLNHPEGVMLHDLVDHKAELREIYSRISTSGLLAEIHSRVDGLVNVNTNSASEKLSKIKTAFIKSVGPDLALHYYIQGENLNKKLIPLNREFMELKF